MKIHYIKTDEKVICGLQVVMNDGRKLEFTTNYENCGLWLNGKQVIGHCDFSLNCSSSTSKSRLKEQALFYNHLLAEDYAVRDDAKFEVSRTPLF